MRDRTMAHLIDADGVTDVPFDRNPDGSWSNAVAVALVPGAVWELGGMTIANGQPLEFTYETHIELD